MERMISLLGLSLIVVLAFCLSSAKQKINWHTVFSGVFLQIAFGVVILKTPLGLKFFEYIRIFFQTLLSYSEKGSSFVFGNLVETDEIGFIFAFKVLPVIIFFSALMSMLYHLGVMQKIIEVIAFTISRVMKLSGAESLAAAANIFVGQSEAPFVVKPFIKNMTRSELLSLMTGGMATIAGGVFAAYSGMGIDTGHLMAASVMSAPAALVCSKLIIPSENINTTKNHCKVLHQRESGNIIEAAADGAIDGLKLAVTVAAMLLAFISLISLFNGILGKLGSFCGTPDLSFELITGYLFSPVAWLLGVPWEDSGTIGGILGKKLILNEFVAYTDLLKIKEQISPRSFTISTYALCGFSNFSSIAIQVGAVTTLAPSRKSDFAKLGVLALIGGTLACLMTACVAGMLI